MQYEPLDPKNSGVSCRTNFDPQGFQVVLFKPTTPVSVLEPTLNSILWHIIARNVTLDGLSDEFVLV